MSVPTKAVEGRQFNTVMGGRQSVRMVVGPACEVKDNGHWYCITHDDAFQNRLQKDSHLDERGKHELCWVCHEHGPEVP